MILLSASKVWLAGQRDGGIWSFLTWTKVIYRFTGIRKRVVRWWKRTFWFSNKVNITFSLNWSMPYQSGCSQVLISSRGFDLPFSLGISPLSHRVFSSRFPMRPSSPTPQGLRPVGHPSKFLPRTKRIRGTIQIRLSFQIDGLLTGPSQLWSGTQPMNQMEKLVL